MTARVDAKKILIVDNEPDNTSVFSIAFEDEGFIIDAFNDPLIKDLKLL